jgi:lysophospholipase L1-like esterase
MPDEQKENAVNNPKTQRHSIWMSVLLVALPIGCLWPQMLPSDRRAPLVLLPSSRQAGGTAQNVVIGCIGDSITYGYLYSGRADPCATMAADLNTMTGTSNYSSYNAGRIGSASANWTTSGELPGGGGNVTTVAPAMVAAGVSVVQIMIGTNDAKTPVVSQSTYQSNLSNIIGVIEANGISKVILHYQPYINTNVGGWTTAISDPALLTYQAAMQAVAATDPNHVLIRDPRDYPCVDPSHVLIGDTTAYEWFEANPSYQSDGVHPTSDGYTVLGKLWATALYQDLGLGRARRVPCNGIRRGDRRLGGQ